MSMYLYGAFFVLMRLAECTHLPEVFLSYPRTILRVIKTSRTTIPFHGTYKQFRLFYHNYTLRKCDSAAYDHVPAGAVPVLNLCTVP